MGITQQIGASSLIKPGVCTSSTRPASPFEGQMIYTTDLDTLEIWNGTAWRIIGAAAVTSGSALQVVQGNTSTASSTTSGTFSDTALTATITPSSTSNKVLVVVSQAGCRKGADNGYAAVSLRLLRGSTTIQNFASFIGYNNNAASVELIIGTISTVYLDSPGTTSATTYKTQFASPNGTGTATVQNALASTINNSTITLIEISA